MGVFSRTFNLFALATRQSTSKETDQHTMKNSSLQSPSLPSRILLLLLVALFCATAYAADSTVVISQVYGGGGNTGSVYKNDFIELFNRSASAVSLDGWSVQYASATGTTWQVTNLTNVTLQPGQYYLVQEAAGTGGTTNLPTPDALGSIAMSATAGKIALVGSTTALSGACPTGVLDIVGFGTTANCSETANAPVPSATNSVIRAGGGCTDAGNNSTDFSAAAAAPRNTATTQAPCGPVTPALNANDVTLAEGNSGTTTFTFTVSLTAPAGASGVSFDYATADNTATVADGDYQSTSNSASITSGNSSTTVNVTVNGDSAVEPNETFFLNITNISGATAGDVQGQGTITNDDSPPRSRSTT